MRVLPRERRLVALREERLEVRAGRPRRGGGPRVRIVVARREENVVPTLATRGDGIVVVVIVVDVMIIERRAATGCSAATAAATATVAEGRTPARGRDPTRFSLFRKGRGQGGGRGGDRGVRTAAV